MKLRGNPKVNHPDCVLSAAGSISRTVALYSQRLIPSAIESAMLVIPVKRFLRGIYGSDLRAAWALLWMALCDIPWNLRMRLKWWWMFDVLKKDPGGAEILQEFEPLDSEEKAHRPCVTMNCAGAVEPCEIYCLRCRIRHNTEAKTREDIL